MSGAAAATATEAEAVRDGCGGGDGDAAVNSTEASAVGADPPGLRRWVRVSVANICWVARAGAGRADDGGGGRESGRGGLRWGAGAAGCTSGGCGSWFKKFRK